MEIPLLYSDAIDVEREKPVQTNWWVITGAPSSGKTTLVNTLNEMGHITVPEAARVIIDEGMAAGKSLEEIRGDRIAFQQVVFAKKEATEEALPTAELVFLDRGSLGDTLAYLAFSLGQQTPDFNVDFPGKEVIMRTPKRSYRGVFLLDQLPFEADYARDENVEVAQLLHRFLGDIYQGLGYDPIYVPVMPIEERVAFVLDHIKTTG